jgi:hypothetical protein
MDLERKMTQKKVMVVEEEKVVDDPDKVEELVEFDNEMVE